MNKTLCLALAAAALLMGACRQTPEERDAANQQEIKITDYRGTLCQELTLKEPIPFMEDNLLQEENTFELKWPDLGAFSPETRGQLIVLAFGDSTATTLEEAAQRFLRQSQMEDNEIARRRKIDSITTRPCNYKKISGGVEQNGDLLLFHTNYEGMVAFAAHGYYGYNSLIVDRKSGRVVHLEDLMDTTGIGEVMIRALEDLVVNRDNGNTTECLFDEYKQRLPHPDGFTIDSTRSVVTAHFNPYSAQPYACGMLFVDMPIYWLSKHLQLTPYGKEIFGPESYNQ